MRIKVSVFEYLNQKVMYIQDVNYYFGIRDDYDIKFGDYELSKEEVLAIAKENDPEEYEVFINTSIEERINKINTYDIDKVKEESSHGQFTLCLHPSRKCNLNCKYCFKESDYLGDEELTFEVAKDAIDFLMDKYAPCASKYVIDLSGSGEPLLQLDLIKQIADYCRQKRNETCKKTEVMFCSNFTLLTPEVADYIDNDSIIFIGTSIDGDKITNDSNREYANGKGTYDDVVKGIKMFKNKKPGLAVTVTPLNQDVDLIYDHLYHLPNVDCVSMKFIRNYDDSKYDFDNFDVPYLVSRYERLCSNIFKELEKGNFDYLKKLLQGADYFGGIIYSNLFKGTYKIHRCDAGKSRVTVNSAGDIFACSVMYGNDDFKIGNIYDGINKIKQKPFEFVSVESLNKCSSCTIKNTCGGECYINAYLKNKDLYELIDKMCLIKIELNKLSMSLINAIKNRFSLMYNKLIDFAFEVNSYEITSSETWVLMYYLKSVNINVNYSEINGYVKSYDNKIKCILDCIGKFYKNVSLYKINNAKDIKSPAIAVVNKIQTNKLDFVLIVDICDGNIFFKDIISANQAVIELSANVFVDKISDIIIF